ncbi:MAG: VanZ family protein [Bacteroidales bacterium]|nr:VanZ family protein [Bacteroidales bacterium]MBS3777403.1 VanZ family protein [Bacteroidales bacterium]
MKLKAILITYLTLLLLATVLPLNSAGEALNENHVFTLRWDYLLHALVYAPLPVLLAWQLKKLWPAVLLALALAAGLELIQALLPYRGFNMNDMVANGTGVLMGGLLTMTF